MVARHAGRVTGPRRSGYVLVVDDDPDIIAFIVDALEDEGYPTESAPNGAAAMEVLARRAPDTPWVILLDFNMPVCDGPAFAAAYKEGPGPHAPVVCLTAAHSASARSREMGADTYLGKPFGLDALLELVARYSRD